MENSRYRYPIDKNMMNTEFKLGLIVNPYAGVGGPSALKGSDGDAIVQHALSVGARLRAPERALRALKLLEADDRVQQLRVVCYRGLMGEQIAVQTRFPVELIGSAGSQMTTADDTVRAARAMKTLGVDLILFAGGDGTARDVYRAVGDDFPVLGVPAGVKMHSGVYAVSPEAAGEILLSLLTGQLVDVGLGEVRDIDEGAFREGRVRAQFYGELLVPRQGEFLQHVKSGGREIEALVEQDIATDIVENMQDKHLYIVGPGTTTRGIMDELGLENTLLGVDAVSNGQLLGNDLSELQLLELLDRHNGPAHIIVTVIGGQGHMLGRGNQQLSPSVLYRVGLNNIIVVASKSKITGLAGRPLLVDTDDPDLDHELTGYRQVVTGYHDAIMYPVGLESTCNEL